MEVEYFVLFTHFLIPDIIFGRYLIDYGDLLAV